MLGRLALSLLLAIPAAGCGLVGFDAATSPSDAGADGAPDGTVTAPPDVLAHVCGYQNVTVILDGDAVDERVGAELAASISSGCATAPTVRSLDQNTPGLLDPVTHAPLLGPNDLGVFGGDVFYQLVMRYLVVSLSPIITSEAGGRYSVTRRDTGATLVDVPLDAITATHDFGVVQIIHDPATESTLVTANGHFFGGTLAASYFFTTSIAPTLTTSTRGFYVIEWTNMDADPEPSAGDTITLITRGP